jgi:LPXTG-motif cell wall-anchored protein
LRSTNTRLLKKQEVIQTLRILFAADHPFFANSPQWWQYECLVKGEAVWAPAPGRQFSEVRKGTFSMKLQLFDHSRKTMVLACGTILAAGLFSVRARADEWDKRTVLTVNQPIQIRDTFLPAGQYVLRLMDSQSNRHVVQIFNGDGTRIIDTVLAIPRQRIEPTSDTEFTFWETPPGSARAMRTWFYPGDTIGNEFPYPKHLRQLAMVQEKQVAQQPPPPPPPEQPQVTENEQPQVEEMQEQQTVEEAPAPTPEPEPSAERAAPPQELPKTASDYPLIGLFGIALAGLAGTLLLKRSA